MSTQAHARADDGTTGREVAPVGGEAIGHMETSPERARPIPRISIQAFCETADLAEAMQIAAEDRRLDLGDGAEMVWRPRQRKRLGGVRLAEEPEVDPAGIPAGRIDDWNRR